MEKKSKKNMKKLIAKEIEKLYNICCMGKPSKNLKIYYSKLKKKKTKTNLYEIQKALLKKKERNILTYNKIMQNLIVARNEDKDLNELIPKNLTKLYNSKYTTNYVGTKLETEISKYDLILKDFIFEEINRMKLLRLLNSTNKKRLSLCINKSSNIDDIQKIKKNLQSKVYKYEKKIKNALKDLSDSEEETPKIDLKKIKEMDCNNSDLEKTLSKNMEKLEIEENKINKITFAIESDNIVLDSEEDEEYLESLKNLEEDKIDEFSKAMEEYEKMMAERLKELHENDILHNRQSVQLNDYINDESIPNRKESGKLIKDMSDVVMDRKTSGFVFKDVDDVRKEYNKDVEEKIIEKIEEKEEEVEEVEEEERVVQHVNLG